MPTYQAMEGGRNKMFVGGKLAILCNCAADVVNGMALVGAENGVVHGVIVPLQ